MYKLLTKTHVFVVLYILIMIPTYIFPYSEASASLSSVFTGSSSEFLFIKFLHFLFLMALVGIGFVRGKLVKKDWLWIFPAIAVPFDLIRVLSMIPLIPTIMHILAIVFGAIKKTEN